MNKEIVSTPEFEEDVKDFPEQTTFNDDDMSITHDEEE